MSIVNTFGDKKYTNLQLHFCTKCIFAFTRTLIFVFPLDNVRKSAYNIIERWLLSMLKDTLKQLREQNNLTKKDLCEKTGISERAYITYEYGQREPKISVIKKLADFYGVSTDYILGRPNAKAPKDPFDEIETIDEMEKDLIKEWLNLDEKSRKSFLDVLRKIVIKEEARNKPVIEKAKYLLKHLSCHKVSAGTGFNFNDDDDWQEAEVYEVPEVHTADFAVEVDGDSMEPVYCDGDILLVKSTPVIDIGDVGVFTLNSCGYVKELGENQLISYNDKYKPINFSTDDDMICWGKVLGKTTRAE